MKRGRRAFSRSFRALPDAGSARSARRQLAAGAGLLDELDELEELDEPDEDAEDDADVEEPEGEPAPTELLEDERLSVR